MMIQSTELNVFSMNKMPDKYRNLVFTDKPALDLALKWTTFPRQLTAFNFRMKIKSTKFLLKITNF